MSTQLRCSLLVVENNPADVALLRYALTRSSIPIDLYAVEDEAAATAFLEQQEPYTTAPPPHLILLELNLPQMYRHTVLVKIKAHPQFKQIPVIIWSSSDSPEDIARGYALGANAYLIKPLLLDDYLRVVQHFVQFWCQTAELPSSVTPEAHSRSGSW